jgi:ATP-dependent DNA ligase
LSIVRKKKHRLTPFVLGEALVKELRLESAILDGELVATDGMCRSVFAAFDAAVKNDPILCV